MSYPAARAGVAKLREHAVIEVSRLPIVLCCAEEAEVALVAVVDALHREGFAPEVVPGVETDTTLLTAATDRVRGPALFVLCQSADLDRFQLRRLEGLFSARKGPDHHMITVELPQRSPQVILGPVREAARELGRGPSHGEPDDGHYMRDVVRPTSVAAVPGAMVPAKPGGSRGRRSAVAQAPEGISDAALGLGGSDTEVIDPRDFGRRAAAPEPGLLITTDPSLGAERGSGEEGLAFDPTPGDGVPLAVPEDYPVVGESSQDVEIRGAPGRMGWDHSGPIDVERVARPSRADPRAESDDRPLPSASSPIDVGRPPPEVPSEPPPRRGARVLLLIVAATGMAAVVTMAVLHATAPTALGPGGEVQDRGVLDAPGGGGGEADARGPEAAEGEAPTARRATATTSAEVNDDPAPEGSTGGNHDASHGSGSSASGHGTAADPGQALDGADPEASGDAATGAEDEDEDDHDDHDPPGDAEPTASAKTVPPPPTADPSLSQLETAIDAAIADGRLQALDDLLVHSTGPGTITWDEAADRCKRRKVDGLRNWRLPSKAQLAALRKAKVLMVGSYWSRSAVGGDEVYVLDAATGRMNQYLKVEPNARAICVRKRP